MKIHIIGCAGAGKDTFALFLRDAAQIHGLTWDIDRFAAPLKTAAKMVFGPLFDYRNRKEEPVLTDSESVMEAIQHALNEVGIGHSQAIGAVLRSDAVFRFDAIISPREFQQELGKFIREISPEAFCDRLRTRSDIIIPDTRFPNEVLDPFDPVIYVHRPGHPMLDHPSERLANELFEAVEEYRQVSGVYPLTVTHPEIEQWIQVIVGYNIDDLESCADGVVRHILDVEEILSAY